MAMQQYYTWTEGQGDEQRTATGVLVATLPNGILRLQDLVTNNYVLLPRSEVERMVSYTVGIREFTPTNPYGEVVHYEVTEGSVEVGDLVTASGDGNVSTGVVTALNTQVENCQRFVGRLLESRALD